MMELLDYDSSEKKQGDLFAKLSFASALLTSLLLAYLWQTRPLKLHACFGISHHMLALNIIQFSLLLGFLFGLISLIKKENPKIMERIGIGLNFTLALLIFGLIIVRLIITL